MEKNHLEKKMPEKEEREGGEGTEVVVRNSIN